MKFTVKSLSIVILLLCCVKTHAQWQFAKGATGAGGDVGSSIAVDAFGYVYVGGVFKTPTLTLGTTILTNDSAGTSDIFLAKYDSLGNLIWAKREGGKGDDIVAQVAVDVQGHVFVAGNTSGPSITFGSTTFTSIGCPRYFLARYTTDGSLTWAKSYDTAYNSIGCPETYSASVVTDWWGNAYLALDFVGTFVVGRDTATTNLYDRTESLILKYDTSGSVRRMSHLFSERYTFVSTSSIAIDGDGNLYGTGSTSGNEIYVPPVADTGGAYIWKHFLFKMDTAGNGVHVMKILSDNCCDVINYKVAVSGAGDLYLAGSFGTSIISDLNIGSVTLRNYARGTRDLFLARYDSALNFKWARQAGGNNNDYLNGICITDNNKIFIAGSFSSDTLYFGTRQLLKRGGNSNIFFAAYDTAGTSLYAMSADSTHDANCNAIATGKGNPIYLTGAYISDSIRFGTHHLGNTDTASTNYYLARYHEIGTEKVEAVSADFSTNVFPNPGKSGESITLSFTQYKQLKQVALLDVLGNTVFETTEFGGARLVHLKLPELPAGIYLIKATTTDGNVAKSLVVIR